MMSPTINSPVYKTKNPSMFNLSSSIRRTASQNNSNGKVDANNRGFSQLVNEPKYPPNQNAGFNSAARDVVRVEPRTGSILSRELKDETSELSRVTLTRGKVAGVTRKPGRPSEAVSFVPASATLPASGVHHHGTDSDVTIQNKNITNGESLKGPSIEHNDKDMTETLSISEADSYIGVNCGSKYKDGEKFSITEPCLYSHRMFIRGAKIFEFLKQDDDTDDEDDVVGGKKGGSESAQAGDIPELDFENPQEQMKTFELTFATLKYQKLFRGILEHSGFFTEYTCFQDQRSLVCIILYDLQSRKFQKYKPHANETVDELCSDIEAALLSKKTRLQSHVAKERIKHNAPSIDYLLPEQVRNKDETKTNTPVFLWVNEMKTTMDDMISALEAENFSRLPPEVDITQQTDSVFQVDTHCSDLLIFPPHLDMYVKDTTWVRSGQLVQQDKSSCLAPQSVKHLIGIDQDVVHVNVGTGITTAHLASLLRKTSPNSHILGFGLDSAEKSRKATKNLEFLGAKNIKLLTDNFLNTEPDEPKFKNVRVVMISANCSKSAITSPVQFIVSEGEDMRFLGELSKADQGLSGLSNLVQDHERLLRHALKFPRVQAVVYSTRSSHEAENELVVSRVLEYIHATNSHRGVPFRVTPPVLPFSSDQIDTGISGVDDRFIRFLPSDKSNGCFVAVISREPEDPKDVARSAIARAKSKGILGRAKSAPQNSEDGEMDTRDISTAGPKRSKSRSHKLKTTAKHSGHKSAAAISTRLYQAGLAQKMEQEATEKNAKPEHRKVVKHPAPFR